MSYENIKLWFAKDKDEKIVTIDEINDENKNSRYLCPVCGSNLKPKAVKSKQVTSHFAHVDASKCNSESQIHFWFKHKFIEKGDKFTVSADKNQEYICREILVEQSYETSYGTYKPDVTVLTECGNTLYFEMAFTNKKQIKDYLDIWLELKNIVVEVDIKQLILKDQLSPFKSLFYDGKCFNTKKNDTYYNIIGKYKEEKLKGGADENLKNRIRKLDWFWEDVFRYKYGEVNIEHMVSLIDILSSEDIHIVLEVLKKQKCVDIFDEFLNVKSKNIYNKLLKLINLRSDKDDFEIKLEDIIKYGKKVTSLINFQYIGKEYVFSIFASKKFDILTSSVEYIENSINNIIENVNKLRFKQLKNNEIKTNIEEIINELSEEYKKCSQYFKIELMEFPGRTVNGDMNLSVYFLYKYRHVLNFCLDNELIYSNDYKLIRNFIANRINEYVNTFMPYDNEQEVYEELKNLNEKYNNYLLRKEKVVEMRLIKSKTATYNTRLEFEYEFHHPNLIRIDIDINKYYTGGSFTRIISKYLCFNDNTLWAYENPDARNKFRNGIKVKEFDIEKNLNEFKEFLNSFIINMVEEYIKLLICEDCEKSISINKNEAIFFIEKGFELPKRCKCCRERRKQQTQGGIK